MNEYSNIKLTWLPVWLMQPNAMVTLIKENNMDQSDLMTVRDTLDAVVSGNIQVEDVVSAIEIVETYIQDKAIVVYEGSDLVAAGEAPLYHDAVAGVSDLLKAEDNDNEAS